MLIHTKSAPVEEPGRDPTTDAAPAPGLECRNCGHLVETNYCPNCGQHNRDHNISVWQFVQEFCEEFIRLDSKLFRTLVPLVTKPGFLTREWVVGRRVRYVTPLKLYITLSAVCFLALGMRSASTKIVITRDAPKAIQALSKVKPGERSKMDELMNWEANKLDLSGPKSTENLLGFRDKFMGLMPTVNFFLLPIFALLFKLLYLRRSRLYVEHLVFALHYYAFCSLMLTLDIAIPASVVSPLLLVWMGVYLFLAMLKNYRQSWYVTILKLAVFGSVYMTIVGLAMLGAVLWTVKDLPTK